MTMISEIEAKIIRIKITCREQGQFFFLAAIGYFLYLLTRVHVHQEHILCNESFLIFKTVCIVSEKFIMGVNLNRRVKTSKINIFNISN